MPRDIIKTIKAVKLPTKGNDWITQRISAPIQIPLKAPAF